MATIRKLQTGKWQTLVRRKGYPEQSKTFLTKSDADQWGRLIESEIERGLFLDRSAAESTTLSVDTSPTEPSRYMKTCSHRRR